MIIKEFLLLKELEKIALMYKPENYIKVDSGTKYVSNNGELVKEEATAFNFTPEVHFRSRSFTVLVRIPVTVKTPEGVANAVTFRTYSLMAGGVVKHNKLKFIMPIKHKDMLLATKDINYKILEEKAGNVVFEIALALHEPSAHLIKKEDIVDKMMQFYKKSVKLKMIAKITEASAPKQIDEDDTKLVQYGIRKGVYQPKAEYAGGKPPVSATAIKCYVKGFSTIPSANEILKNSTKKNVLYSEGIAFYNKYKNASQGELDIIKAENNAWIAKFELAMFLWTGYPQNLKELQKFTLAEPMLVLQV